MASDNRLIHDSLPLIRLNCITEVITKARGVVAPLKWELLSLPGYLNLAVYVFLPGAPLVQPDTTSPIASRAVPQNITYSKWKLSLTKVFSGINVCVHRV